MGHYTIEACVNAERGLLEEAQTAAQTAGLQFDGTCVEDLVDSYAALGCGGFGQFRSFDFPWQCAAYHADVPEGEGPCQEIVGAAFSNCDAGLICREFGGSCQSLEEESCDCAADEKCVDAPLPTCIPKVAQGDVCRTEAEGLLAACGPQAQCLPSAKDPETMICVAGVGVGEPCTSPPDVCSPGLHCEFGECVPVSPILCMLEASPGRWR